MKIFVTGPDGVLGSNLVRALIDTGHEVTVLLEKERKAPTLEKLAIRRVTGDVLDLDTLLTCTSEMEVLIHCAALTHLFPPKLDIVNRVNIEGTKNVIRACKENKVKRLIYVGTANSFGSGSMEKPGNEKQIFTAGQYGLAYIDSKYMAQKLVIDAASKKHIDAVVVNPTFMIGPYDSKPSSGAMLLSVYNKKLPGYTQGGKNYVYVKDVAVGIINAITLGKNGECYILGNENLNYKTVFSLMGKVSNVTPPRLKLPSFLVLAFGRFNTWLAKYFGYTPTVSHEIAQMSIAEHYYSAEKARKELKLPSTPIEYALKESFDWFKKNGYTE